MDGASPSTVRNAIMPLRVLYRRALRAAHVAVSPLEHLELPAVRSARERIASPAEAAELLKALPPSDRAVWATALHAGLRLGELKALRVEDADLDGGLIAVVRSWDVVAGAVEPKSRSGRRRCRSPRSCASIWRSTSFARAIGRGSSSAGRKTRPFAHVTLRERAHRGAHPRASRKRE
jgi:integrase